MRGNLIIGDGPVFEALLAGTPQEVFSPQAAWPEGWGQLPANSSYALMITSFDKHDTPPEVELMGLSQALLGGGFGTETVLAMDLEDDTYVTNTLGGAQFTIAQGIAQVRPMAPPFAQGWVSYAELLTNAMWGQISIERAGTVTSVTVAAPTCGVGSGAAWTLAGLANLTTVGDNLGIEDMVALTNLDGLENLTTLEGYLWITGNDALTNLDGLENLTTVGDDLIIENNTVLCQDDVDTFVATCTIGGSTETANNDGTCP